MITDAEHDVRAPADRAAEACRWSERRRTMTTGQATRQARARRRRSRSGRTRPAPADRTRPSLKPSVLSTASSLVRSRIDCAMVLPVTSRIVKSTAPAIAHHDAADVADLLGEAGDEGLLGRRSWSRSASSRTCASSCLRDVLGLRRVLQLDHVPADLVVAVGLVADRLVQVVVVEEELRLVDALLGRVVDAVDGELPRRAVGRAIDRRPGAARGRRPSSRSARARSAPTIAPVRSASQAFFWSSGTANSGIDPQPALRVDRHVGEEVLRILVDAAEPVGVRDRSTTPSVDWICCL